LTKPERSVNIRKVKELRGEEGGREKRRGQRGSVQYLTFLVYPLTLT